MYQRTSMNSVNGSLSTKQIEPPERSDGQTPGRSPRTYIILSEYNSGVPCKTDECRWSTKVDFEPQGYALHAFIIPGDQRVFRGCCKRCWDVLEHYRLYDK